MEINMAKADNCPDLAKLRLLLNELLPPPEQEQLALHLDCCEKCQHALDGLAAGQDSWSQAPKLADSESEATSPALKHAVAELEGCEPTMPPQAPDKDLNFLDPPHEPGNLGRLDHYEILEV